MRHNSFTTKTNNIDRTWASYCASVMSSTFMYNSVHSAGCIMIIEWGSDFFYCLRNCTNCFFLLTFIFSPLLFFSLSASVFPVWGQSSTPTMADEADMRNELSDLQTRADQVADEVQRHVQTYTVTCMNTQRSARTMKRETMSAVLQINEIHRTFLRAGKKNSRRFVRREKTWIPCFGFSCNKTYN